MSIHLKHLDKVLFPIDKITKEDLLVYYLNVAALMLPLVKNHPLTQHRFPDGIDKDGFIQKNINTSLSKIKTVSVVKKENKEISMLLCNNKETLIYLVNQGCIAFHIALSRANNLDKPDKVVFDLDPSTKNFEKVKEAAFALKELLEVELKLKTFIMTTGSKGLHIIIPIKPLLHFDKVKEFSKKVAQFLCERNPQKFTIEIRKNKRKNKVFIDYLRNAYNQTSVAPYSVRALKGAPIAMPISWKDLKNKKMDSQCFCLKNYKKELLKISPWVGFNSTKQNLTTAIKKLEKLFNT